MAGRKKHDIDLALVWRQRVPDDLSEQDAISEPDSDLDNEVMQEEPTNSSQTHFHQAFYLSRTNSNFFTPLRRLGRIPVTNKAGNSFQYDHFPVDEITTFFGKENILKVGFASMLRNITKNPATSSGLTNFEDFPNLMSEVYDGHLPLGHGLYDPFWLLCSSPNHRLCQKRASPLNFDLPLASAHVQLAENDQKSQLKQVSFSSKIEYLPTKEDWMAQVALARENMTARVNATSMVKCDMQFESPLFPLTEKCKNTQDTSTKNDQVVNSASLQNSMESPHPDTHALMDDARSVSNAVIQPELTVSNLQETARPTGERQHFFKVCQIC